MNLFELFVKIGVDDQASNKLKDLGGKLGNGLKTAAKIGTAAVTAAATGITALTTAAVKNYAEYEQLVGGVQTLFNKTELSLEDYAKSVGKTTDEALEEWGKLTTGARIVQNNADAAFRSAGLSANEYMSTVTSFSASLIASLKGDTVAAAKAADRAVIDMADNANKMGTDMELIQNAYQGFAKQNYTMLDNLKLGYGGTKEEMSRLIADAAKMTDVQKKLNLTVDAGDMSFGNIVNAISVMQKKMGLAGATANEAATTISGSLGMLKASWQNVLTAFSDDNASGDNMLYTYIQDLVESATTAFNNLLPAVQQALIGIAELITELAPKIVEKIPEVFSKILPALIKGSTEMVNAVVDVLPSLLETVVTALVENAPLLIEAAIDLVNSLIQSIQDNSQILIDGAINIVMTLANGILSMLPQIISLGLNLIVSLATGIANSLPTLIPTIIDTIMLIVNTLTNPDMLSKILDAALVLIIELAFGLMDAIPQLVDSALIIVERLVDFLLDPENLGKLINAAIQIVVALGVGLVKAIPRLIKSAIKLVADLVKFFFDYDWGKLGKNIVDGLLDGLKRAWESLKKWISNAWDSLVGGIKDFLGIHSPSRVFAGIGKNMALGVGEGWDDAFGDIQDDINSSMDFGESDYGITTSSTSISDFGGGSSRYGYGGSQNVNVTVGIDDSANAMGLARALLPFLKIAEKEVYA